MGDGRYYTFIQFSNIFYNMLLMILASVFIGRIFIYKKSFQSLRYYGFCLVLISLSICFRFLELVAYNLSLASTFFILSSSVLLILPIINTWYHHHLTKKKMTIVTSLFHSLILMYFMLQPPTYTFGKVIYNKWFIVLLGLNMMVMLGEHFYIMTFIEEYNIRKHIFIVSTGFIVVYLAWWTTIVLHLGPLYYYLLLVPMIHIYLSIKRYMPNDYQSEAYNEIITAVTDTIILLDITGKILFTNRDDLMPVLNIKDHTLSTDLDLMFNAPLEKSTYLSTYELKSSQSHYLNIDIETIQKKGYIVRIQDLTPLHWMLKKIKSDHLQLKKIHQALEAQANVAGELEMATIKNQMLTKVNSLFKQENEKINTYSASLLKKGFVTAEDLEVILDLSRDHLSNIRENVTKFRRTT